MHKIERAIISCHDKTGVVELAQALREFGIEIISTEGTHKVLTDAGVETQGVSEFTGVREMMNGRVKSLHPKIHAGLLGIRDNKTHVEEMQTYGCQWIDLAIINIHPVKELIERPNITPEEVIDQIDIGGVAMIRSAAKNCRYVSVVVNPDRYAEVIRDLRAHEGTIPYTTRFKLAQEAFSTTSDYDAVLEAYFADCQPSEE